MAVSSPCCSIDTFSTVVEMFENRVAASADEVAIRQKDFGLWLEFTWRDWGDHARWIGLGLKALGLERGDVVSIASEVNREWMFSDLGALGVGAVVNGVYPTDSPSQVEYLIADSGTRFYFAEDEEQLDKVLEVRDRTPTLERIFVFDMRGLRDLNDSMCMSLDELLQLGQQYEGDHHAVWETETRKARPADLMILIYTSGTTGPPKGSMISHANMLFMVEVLRETYQLDGDEELLGFLPLAHVAGRMFYTFAVIGTGSTINLVEDLETVVRDSREAAPTAHFAVPRVWEKQYSMVTILRKEATWLGRLALDMALQVGRRRAQFVKEQRSVPTSLAVAYFLLDFLVLKNVRKLLGINRCKWLSSGGAPISPDLIEWFWALGRPMYEVYGQTECTGLATANVPGDTRIGSVGKAVPGVEVALSDDQEILIRSPGTIMGYWNNAEKSADTIQQGWLYTGDIGRIDDDGFVYIVDRKKDIIITSGGKNITPSELENQLKFSPYVTDAVVVGDARPYLTCLVMIDLENVAHFAQVQGVPFTNYKSLCHAQEVEDLIGAEIEQVNRRFARVETIKKFRLIDQLLDAEDEELTPTQKLKRRVVSETYSTLIDEMYRSR